MAVEVILPRVDMDMAQAKISKWHVKEGDAVKAGAALFEIETDKAAMEIEAPASGIVRNITVAEGTIRRCRQRGRLHLQRRRSGRCAAAEGRDTTRAGLLQPRRWRYLPTWPRRRAPLPGACVQRRWHGAWRAKLGLQLSDVNGTGPHGRIVADDVQTRAEARGSTAPLPREPAAGGCVAALCTGQLREPSRSTACAAPSRSALRCRSRPSRTSTFPSPAPSTG